MTRPRIRPVPRPVPMTISSADIPFAVDTARTYHPEVLMRQVDRLAHRSRKLAIRVSTTTSQRKAARLTERYEEVNTALNYWLLARREQLGLLPRVDGLQRIVDPDEL